MAPSFVEGAILSGFSWSEKCQAGQDHNGTARYLTRDHLGSVRELTDSSSALVTRNEYDPYGRVTKVNGTEDTQFEFTGHYMHVESGLAMALYRVYDPGLGLWLSEDPSGKVDGPNLYAYAERKPNQNVDRLGLFTVSVGVGFGGGFGPWAGAFSSGFVFDSHGGAGAYWGWGIGGGTGAGIGGGFDFGFSPNAQDVCQMGGLFTTAGGSLGDGGRLGAGTFVGADVSGVTGAIGVGAGADATVMVTNTHVIKF